MFLKDKKLRDIFLYYLFNYKSIFIQAIIIIGLVFYNDYSQGSHKTIVYLIIAFILVFFILLSYLLAKLVRAGNNPNYYFEDNNIIYKPSKYRKKIKINYQDIDKIEIGQDLRGRTFDLYKIILILKRKPSIFRKINYVIEYIYGSVQTNFPYGLKYYIILRNLNYTNAQKLHGEITKKIELINYDVNK